MYKESRLIGLIPIHQLSPEAAPAVPDQTRVSTRGQVVFTNPTSQSSANAVPKYNSSPYAPVATFDKPLSITAGQGGNAPVGYNPAIPGSGQGYNHGDPNNYAASPRQVAPGPTETPSLNASQSEGFSTVQGYNKNTASSLDLTKASDALKYKIEGTNANGNAIVTENGVTRDTGMTAEEYKKSKQQYVDFLAEDKSQKETAAQKIATDKETALDAMGKEKTSTETAVDPSTSAIAAKLRAIGPDMEPLAAAIEAQAAAAARTQAEAITNANDQNASLQKESADVKTQMEKIIADTNAMASTIEAALKQNLDETNAHIAQSEAAADQRLVWTAQQQQRTLSRQELKQHESMIVQSALFGGFGQDASIRAINESDNAFEDKIREVQTNLGMDRTDLAVKYSGLYVENNSKYREGLISVLKDTQAQLTSINMQGINNTHTVAAAERTIMQNKFNELSALRKETAANNLANVKEMDFQLNQKRDDDRAQETLGWNVLDKAIDDYGSNIPQSLLSRIGKMLPGVDLVDIAKAKTLAQLKKSGSGGGGYTFSAGQFNQSTGAPPSFASFVNDKQKAFDATHGEVLGMSGSYYSNVEAAAQKFDRSAKAMAEYQKEYDTKYASAVHLNPTDIVRRFDRKTMTLTGKQLTTAQTLFSRAMQDKDYEYASQIADDTGDDIDATSAGKFVNALNSRQDVDKMAGLINTFGTQGPLTGRMRNLDPYDDKAVQFKQLIIEAVPSLARGVFNEVGVLTNEDRDTYTSVIGNPKLTIGQAITAFNDLKEKIDRNMKNQIDIWDADRRSVGGFRRIYESQPSNIQNSAQDHLDSLPTAQ